MLFGCLLGDAHIGVQGNGKVYITFEQAIKHKDYVMYIYDVLKGIDGIELSEIKYYKRTDSRYNSINESIYFKMYGTELLCPLAAIALGCSKNAIHYYEKQRLKTREIKLLKGRYIINVIRS